MSTPARLSTPLFMVLCTIALGGSAWWIATRPGPVTNTDKAPPAATVPKVVSENDLNTVILSDAAEKRIGLQLGKVVEKSVQRTRIYSGESTLPPGRTITIAAPMTGILQSPKNLEVKPGSSVKSGETVMLLTPLLTPDGRATLMTALAEADGQVNNAQAQLELAKIALTRATRIFKEEAGSQRQVDEAQTAHQVAEKTLAAATARRQILKKVVGDVDAGTTSPIAIESPITGMIRAVTAQPGQTVPSGSNIVEVIDVTTIWLRVAVPVSDLDELAIDAAAQVSRLSSTSIERPRAAKAIAAPPSANPIVATVDLFYELSNTDGKLFPGQRLGVTIPMKSAQTSLIVPWAAIVFDIHGGTWVYEQVAPGRYQRKRVTVAFTVGENAILASTFTLGDKTILASSLRPGGNVVIAGAQELFGAETGFIK